MADEATLTYTLRVANATPPYQPSSRRFLIDVAGEGGPTPGTIDVSTSGTDVSLAQLPSGRPGIAEFINLDDTNFVDWGVYEPNTNTFYPVGRLYPGQGHPITLCPDIGEEWGTATAGSATSTLRFRANGDSCKVYVAIFPE